MGLLDRWDERNQRRAELDNVRLGGDDWAHRLNADTLGPRVAGAFVVIPVIGWIAAAAVAVDAWRRRRRAPR